MKNIVVFALALCVSVAAFAHNHEKGKGHGKGKGKDIVMTLVEDAQFNPMDPKNPDAAPHVANANGDIWKGHAWFWMKIKKGESPMHKHSGDYHAVLIKGQSKHWGEGQTVADAKVVNPGGYWFQPGGQFHGDACLADECLVMIHSDKKFDFTAAPATEAKKQ